MTDQPTFTLEEVTTLVDSMVVSEGLATAEGARDDARRNLVHSKRLRVSQPEVARAYLRMARLEAEAARVLARYETAIEMSRNPQEESMA
jgi:hypothetical protein